MKRRPQSQKDLASIILCSIGAIFCIPFIKSTWLYLVIFVVVILLRLRMYKKHKELENKFDEFLDGFDNEHTYDEENTKKGSFLTSKEEKKRRERQRQAAYEKLLSDLDEELGRDEENIFEEEKD